MSLYTVAGILFCAVLVCIMENEFMAASTLSESLLVHHGGIHRRLHHRIHHRMHNSIEHTNHGRSRNLSRIIEDENTTWNSSTPRRKRQSLIIQEVSVKEAWNTSFCSYRIEKIGKQYGSWLSENIFHVKCNGVKKKCINCNGTKSCCCMQTFQMVDVDIPGTQSKKPLKIYTGCVCAYLPQHPMPTVQSLV